MKIKFIPIDYDYFDYQGRNYARIIGRNEKSKKVCLIDSIDAYFWAILKKGINNKKIEKVCEKINEIKIKGKTRDSKVLKTEVYDKKFLGKNVKAIKIFVSNYKDAHDIADKIDFKEIDKRREYDLGYVTRYIIEKKLKPLNWYEIEGDNANGEILGVENLDVDLCLKVNKIKETDGQFKPRILAYDIETDEFEIGKGQILMVSLVGDNFKKVITWKKDSKKSYIEKVKDEEELLEKFVYYVKKYDPDILTGYFSDGFDLPYLRARAEKNNMKLNLGVDNSQPTFTRGRLLSGKIKGIVSCRFIKIYKSDLFPIFAIRNFRLKRCGF